MKYRNLTVLLGVLLIVALFVAGPVCDEGDDSDDDDDVIDDDDDDNDDNDTIADDDDDDDSGPKIDWCGIVGPNEIVTTEGQPSEMIFGRVEIKGVTGTGTPQPYVTAELGYGYGDPAEGGGSSWTWFVMGFNEGHYGSGTDEYGAKLLIGAPEPPFGTNTYAYVMRVTTSADPDVHDDDWTYCDTGQGSSNDFNKMDLGRIFVGNHDIDWCEITSPDSVSIEVGEFSDEILGQVFVDGLTELPGSQIPMELGHGPLGVDPRMWPDLYSWSPSDFDQQVGDNDQFSDSLIDHVAGTYSYVYAATIDFLSYTYCDFHPGTGNGFSVDDLGTLTVTAK
jgi:hypothetical protein